MRYYTFLFALVLLMPFHAAAQEVVFTQNASIEDRTPQQSLWMEEVRQRLDYLMYDKLLQFLL